MPARLTREGEKLVLSIGDLGGAAFGEALAKAKAIPGRRYNPEHKTWEFPADTVTANKILHSIQPEPDATVTGWLRQALQAQADDLTTKLPHVGQLPFPLEAELYQHQRDAVGFLTKNPHTIIADDMGLGKTLEAIAAVHAYYMVNGAPELSRGPKLVISPSSMLGKWAAEIERWAASGTPIIIPGRMAAPKRAALLKAAVATPDPWIIVNWEQVRAQKIKLDTAEAKRKRRKYEWQLKAPILGQTPWAAVIADEAHRAKNKDAQQTRGLWQLKAPLQLALTGTPVMNSPDELWSILAWLRPEAYAEYSKTAIGYWAFYNTFVDYYEGYYGKIVTGVRNPDALRFELADKLIRRTKGRTLDLPAKTRTIIPLELLPKQRKLYKEAERALFLEVQTAYGAALETPDDPTSAKIVAAAKAGDLQRFVMLVPNAAAKNVRLRQIASTPALLGGPDESVKLDAAVETIGDNPGKQFVTFSLFRGTAQLLAERLRKRKLRVATFTGDTPPEERTALEAQFQAGDLDVLCATIGAGGEGLTLTAADTAIFTEREYTPARNEQAESRLDRIGQSKPVSILILQATNTIDDDSVAAKNRLKELIVGSIVQQDQVQERKAA